MFADGIIANERAIPTRVGKSYHFTMQLTCSTGHPHAGGEIGRALAKINENLGPSPRGWGNRRGR